MEMSRLDFVFGGAASLAAFANLLPEPVRGVDGATLLGPRNVGVERENPDLLAAPSTDAGTLPNLKFPFDAAHNRLTDGGWAGEVTEQELAAATQLAAVNMRLKPGVRSASCTGTRLLSGRS